MIIINSLTKKYRTRKKGGSTALTNINLTLPDAGLVFVLGKSGSGKSTLLNLIGGLDNITEGSITVNGNNLASFREKDFCNYRNSHIGFIFQDYHLLDELTVEENIAISLRLKNAEEGNKIQEALSRVDLAGYEDRYPSELSGGERQRVAIARAIVKNPRIILADEPTGNLDTVTSRAILELLKELSKDCLILIVSHNLVDANTYADRIIELRGGKIIEDKMRNPDFPDEVMLDTDLLIYPDGAALSDSDIELINSNPERRIVKRKDKYIRAPFDSATDQKVNIENKGLHFRDSFRLCKAFVKNKTSAITLSAFMVSVIMVIMALAQTMIGFDSGRIMERELSKTGGESILLLKAPKEEDKELLDTNYRVEIGSEDISALKAGGYGGNVYPVLNVTTPISSCNHILGIKNSYFAYSPYIRESLGTMIVDEDFITRKFGSLTYAAILDDPYPEGVIITDYIADCMIATNSNYKSKSYSDILGEYLPSGWTFCSLKINAVIETGYRERHADLFEKMTKVSKSDFRSLYEDADFIAFMSEIYESLGYCYTLNPEYLSVAHQGRRFFSHGKIVVNDLIELVDNNSPYISFVNHKKLPKLAPGEASMSMTKYNKIFGTSYDSTTAKDFVPHTIKITSHRFYDVNNEDPLYTVELKIVNLHAFSDTFIISPDGNDDLISIAGKNDTYFNALYCEGAQNLGKAINTAERLGYTQENHLIEGIRTMTKAVDVFVPIFELIAVFLCVGVIFILTNFSSRMINDKMHEIGILKAIGTKNRSIGIIFGLQVALITLLTCIMSTFGYYIFIDIADNILIESLRHITTSMVVMDLDFLTFNPWIALTNCVLIVILTAISVLSPLAKIKSIKPVEIIKAKE